MQRVAERAATTPTEPKRQWPAWILESSRRRRDCRDLRSGQEVLVRRVLVQRVLVTTDLPSWDLQLRSDPPSYALGATTNYYYYYDLLLLTRTVFQPLSLCSASNICGSRLFLSTMRCPSGICAPRAANLSAASFPRTPVCDLTCSILTSSPLHRVRLRYAFYICEETGKRGNRGPWTSLARWSITTLDGYKRPKPAEAQHFTSLSYMAETSLKRLTVLSGISDRRGVPWYLVRVCTWCCPCRPYAAPTANAPRRPVASFMKKSRCTHCFLKASSAS